MAKPSKSCYSQTIANQINVNENSISPDFRNQNLRETVKNKSFGVTQFLEIDFFWNRFSDFIIFSSKNLNKCQKLFNTEMPIQYSYALFSCASNFKIMITLAKKSTV